MLKGIAKAILIIAAVVMADQYFADGFYTDGTLSMLSRSGTRFIACHLQNFDRLRDAYHGIGRPFGATSAVHGRESGTNPEEQVRVSFGVEEFAKAPSCCWGSH